MNIFGELGVVGNHDVNRSLGIAPSSFKIGSLVSLSNSSFERWIVKNWSSVSLEADDDD